MTDQDKQQPLPVEEEKPAPAPPVMEMDPEETTPKVEVVTEEERAFEDPVLEGEELARLEELAEQSLLDVLQQRGQVGEQIIRQRAKLLQTLRTESIRLTNPTDWVIFKDREGNQIGHLKAAGCEKVAPLWAIRMTRVGPLGPNQEPQPEEVALEGGIRAFKAWADFESGTVAKRIPRVMAQVREDEAFTGRKTGEDGKLVKRDGIKTDVGDLQKALYTGLRSRGIRALTGLARVPMEDLDRAWAGTAKSSANADKGSGFGASKERGHQAKSVGTAAELWKQCLGRTASEDDARKLFREITYYKTGAGKEYAGVTKPQDLTIEWRVEAAWRKLREHEVFGDKPSNGNGGTNGGA